MRHFLLCLMILCAEALNTATACGPYYPFGEDVRFSLLPDNAYAIPGMNGLRYSFTAFAPDEEAQLFASGINIELWRKYSGSALPSEVIYDGVYNSGKELNDKIRNEFLIELKKNGKTEAKIGRAHV